MVIIPFKFCFYAQDNVTEILFLDFMCYYLIAYVVKV